MQHVRVVENPYTLPEYNLGHLARCCTKAVMEAMSASDQSEMVHIRPIWFHQGSCAQQEN